MMKLEDALQWIAEEENPGYHTLVTATPIYDNTAICEEMIRRGPRENDQCTQPARWHDQAYDMRICHLHAAAAVRSETIAREDLTRLGT